MGDNIKRFQADDIVLVGSDTPHFWRHDGDEVYQEDSVFSTVMPFVEAIWGKKFIQLPENILIKNLMIKSKRGLLLTGKTRDSVATLIEKIKGSEGTYKLLYLLECLVAMAVGNENEVIPLSYLGFEHQATSSEKDRINQIYEYCFAHFKEKILLQTIADEVGLAPSSFCRYFKSKTGKGLTEFLLELTVGNACRLLQQNNLNIKQIC